MLSQDIYIWGVSFNSDSSELEVYSLHHQWWGIPMSLEQASGIIEKLQKSGVFFWKDTRHILYRG